MPIAKSNGASFKPCPAGMFQAVCVDVIDKGLVDTPWGSKPKVIVRWQVNVDMEDGKPFLIQKRYTLSLHEKATLRHDLESWRGAAFSEEQAQQGFEIDRLLDANCQMVVVHRTDNKGDVWANVQTLTPLLRGMTKMTVRDYTRERDRADTTNGGRQTRSASQPSEVAGPTGPSPNTEVGRKQDIDETLGGPAPLGPPVLSEEDIPF